MAFAFPRALGAGHGGIVRMVLASALRLAAIGVVLGTVAAGVLHGGPPASIR
jgi:hypothetical protein